MLAEVKGWDVFRYHAVIDHIHVAVVTSSGVHVVPGPLCRIQHVCNPQPLQIILVLCRLPERTRRQYEFDPRLANLVGSLIRFLLTHLQCRRWARLR